MELIFQIHRSHHRQEDVVCGRRDSWGIETRIKVGPRGAHSLAVRKDRGRPLSFRAFGHPFSCGHAGPHPRRLRWGASM